MSDLNKLEGLNSRQKEAIAHLGSPLLVLAGAGTGKTKVLVHRIAHLIGSCQVNPWKILALTFTNKASKEMKERVETIIGFADSDMVISTFHSLCLRILKWEAKSLDFISPGFAIADRKDQTSVVNKLIRERPKIKNETKARNVLGRISAYKRAGISPDEVATESVKDEIILELYIAYQKFLHESDLMDFDDLIFYANRLLGENETIRLKYQSRWKHILIDEYQDTNSSQFQLIKYLTKQDGENLCVVGDEDQSIYGFRGAEIRNILELKNHYPSLKIIKLEENYRSTKNIISAATEMISTNEYRIGKVLFTNNQRGTKIMTASFSGDREEAVYVIKNALHHSQQNQESLDNFAVLYRTNDQSRSYEDACRYYGLPYVVRGGLRFYDRKIIKDFLGYFRLLANPNDNASFLRIINTPARGAGKKSLERISQKSEQTGLGYFNCLRDMAVTEGFRGKAGNNLKKFVSIFSHDYEGLNFQETFNYIYENSGFKELLEREDSAENQEKIAHLAQLLASMEGFSNENSFSNILETVKSYLESVTLDGYGADAEAEDKPGVLSLMTVHCAKGLEFNTVYITGLEDGIFPYLLHNNNQDEEEERRLFYVAMTRAKTRLYLLRSRNRMIFGQRKYFKQSRFLKEIPDQYLKSDYY